MPIVNSELYRALLAAGAPYDNASEAAEALAQLELRLVRIEALLRALGLPLPAETEV